MEPTNAEYQFFVFEVQSYLFVFHTAKFWTFLHFLGSLGLFFGLGSGSKTFLEPTNVDYQFFFRKYSPVFFFLFSQILGHFAFVWPFGVILFGPLGAIFGV